MTNQADKRPDELAALKVQVEQMQRQIDKLTAERPVVRRFAAGEIARTFGVSPCELRASER